MGALVKISRGEVELDGFVEVAENARVILLHFHGLAGNFYENTFVRDFAEELPKNGIGFVSANLRGHDYLADAVRCTDGEYLDSGAAHTTLDEYVADIRAWMLWVHEEFGLPVVIQSHSAAGPCAADVIDAGFGGATPLGSVFLSPADMLGEIRGSVSEERLAELIEGAKRDLGDSNPNALVPSDALPGYLLDARVYTEFLNEDRWRWFSQESPALTSRILAALPTLIVFGEEEVADDAHLQSALEEWGRGTQRVAIVPRAGHSYRGEEYALVAVVKAFIESVLIL
jgi:Alpha/beta hydrolase family